MEALLGYLRSNQPDAILDVMCWGPEIVKERYGITAIPMGWFRGRDRCPGDPMKAVGRASIRFG